jgi:hypothetical protein
MKTSKKFIILRHDVDLSLSYALKLAKLEADHGLRVIYFVLLHTDLHNAMSESGTKALRQMSDMRHKIGLHIDTRFFRLDKPILSQIEEECKILENIMRQEVVSISQNTPIITPDLPSEFTSRYIEARDPKILEYLKYISDSGRNWRQERMCHHIGVDDKMQILVHSEWSGEKNVPLEQILLSIKDAPKIKIDRLSTVAVANLQLHKDKMFRGLV